MSWLHSVNQLIFLAGVHYVLSLVTPSGICASTSKPHRLCSFLRVDYLGHKENHPPSAPRFDPRLVPE